MKEQIYITITGGNGYNYAIIPLLELLGIDAMSQQAYNSAVANNHGSVLYPILSQLINAVENDILKNPINWLTSILANLCYALGSGQITTIIDNLIAPINMLIAKVDKIIPVAIEVDVAALINGGSIGLYLGKAHEGVDAGMDSRVAFAEVLKSSKTILMNGPVGAFENPAFAEGTKAVLAAIVEATKNGAVSVIGGGDSVSAAKKFCKAEDFTHVSTGGGASLEFIEGKVLPGVAALDDK